MIRELQIKNIALIEAATLEFDRGLTVFTGETGAGKSILIGSIGLLLGERGSAEIIRRGCDEAEVVGIFQLSPKQEPFATLLTELDIPSDEGELIIRRRISRTDRGRIQINQTTVPLTTLRRLGDALIDLHGQHEHQSLLNETTHHLTIDSLENIPAVFATYREAFHQFQKSLRQLEEHDQASLLLAEKRDLLDFQYKEIKQLQLKSGEEEELEQELALLSSSSERTSRISEILELLGTSDDSIEKRINTIRRKLEQLCKYDQSVAPWLDDVDTALRVFTELEAFGSSYLSSSGANSDPRRIEWINTRLAKIQRLKKKYATTLDGLLAKQTAIQSDLAAIENSDSDRKELEKLHTHNLAACSTLGQQLTKARVGAAASFDRQIGISMETLGFSGGNWKTDFQPCALPTEQGYETIRFLVRTNRGEALLPLAKTASGGEISRLMLAIKTILAHNDRIPVLIFDEIDTGIGGVLAGKVAQALEKLSKTHQVLCISHLHQIASRAEQHVKVFKETVGDRTVTRVACLSFEDRVREIARMLGGENEIELKHARSLLMRA